MPQPLGQNFLNNSLIVDRIADSADIRADDLVLEIGPGKGILTEKLCQKAGKVIAVELDQNLKELLEQKFKNQKNLEIIFADILKINLPQILREREISTYKLVANIPYYITSKIIRLFLETEIKPTEMILMIQKEVAERIIARPGGMSKLSASVQYYAAAEILFDVEPSNFTPPPEVTSSVIRIKNIKSKEPRESKKYFRLVRAGFCARRKTLLNNLSNSLGLDKKTVEAKLIELNLNPQIRAQELSVKNWQDLSRLL
ncbi:MAG: 16S rRNA (adenine(1518)-N(6)/adenine(1519)-N(6))-dimethyltransferase RsmA [Candidatus Moraniibacteriota bacterium]